MWFAKKKYLVVDGVRTEVVSDGSQERIEQAGRDWTEGTANSGMDQVPSETERIPLPQR